MRYLPETAYFHAKDFPSGEALLWTAIGVSAFASTYEADLIGAPKRLPQEERVRSGTLPKKNTEREAFVRKLIQWIMTNEGGVVFRLIMRRKDASENEIAPFEHWSTVGSWNLGLDEDEFRVLQDLWAEHELPRDLFYPEHAGVCVEKSYLGGLIKTQRCYSPKEWEVKQRE